MKLYDMIMNEYPFYDNDLLNSCSSKRNSIFKKYLVCSTIFKITYMKLL